MHPLLVVGKERGGRAPVWASRAGERLLARVGPRVVLQRPLALQHLPTGVAEICFCFVHTVYVTLQVT